MNNKGNNGLGDYNRFCKNLMEGNILYNIDSTNLWSEYLLVANITPIRIKGVRTYTITLLGLKKQNGKYTPINQRISMTPDYTKYIPFLKPVGFCKFKLIPDMTDVEINVGLVATYGSTDLHKFTSKLSIRKPKFSKYDMEGKLIIKKADNK